MIDIVVETPSGLMKGEAKGGLVYFRTIPFVEAPVGKRRWAAPEPKAPWAGVLDSTIEGPILPQGPSDLDRPMGAINRELSEAALTLTLVAPENAKDLPVIVWFHGGANFCGAGSLDWYDGSTLAKACPAVFVGVNYRLGALGFLQYPGVNEENLAVLDWIAALQWVNTHILSFGGDPERVTLVGQSAGGNAIVTLAGIPETDGLFESAWIMSPSIGRGNHKKADAHRIAKTLLSAAGCRVDTDLETLREDALGLSVKEILLATDAAFKAHGKEFGGMLFKPVDDALFEPAAVIEKSVAGAKRKNLRIILGTTLNETLAFSDDRSPEALKHLAKVQDARFDTPALEYVRALNNAGVPARKYRFDWEAPGSIYGACHCIDLPFLFGTFPAWKSPMLAGGNPERMAALWKRFSGEFIRFVRGEEPSWPLFGEKEYVEIFNEEN